MRRLFSLLVVLSLAARAQAASPGEAIYKVQCALCHPVDHSLAQGPGLGRVLGRRAATLAGFSYSPALKQSGLRWTNDTLDRFLANPAALVPGTTMPIPVPDAITRRDLIAYLATLRSTVRPNLKRSAVAGPVVVARPGEVLRGAAALGGFRNDAPGVTRHIIAAGIPAPFATSSARNGPQVVHRPPDTSLHVPAGFAIEPFAQLQQPRLLRTAPNGDLFVAESLPGKIVIVRPHGDGADAPRVFVEGLDRPFGIAFWPPGPEPKFVYVAENNRIVRYAYTTGDLAARGAPEVVVPKLTDGSAGHWTRDIAFSPDGKKMYVSVGSASNVAEGLEKKSAAEIASWEKQEGLGAGWGEETHRACVLMFDERGQGVHVFAAGIRNCVGMAVDARGAVWCATNERDGLGDDLVPDYVTRVTAGAFYGWPFYYLGDHEDPRHAGARPDLRGKMTMPEVLLQSHSAALEPAIYDGAQFPPEYRGDLFVALHGSWNAARRTGYKIVRVRTHDGVPTGEYEDFVTGFVVDDDRVWGRPVGVAVARDGSLYFSEDGNSVLWRVRYLGAAAH